MLRKILLLAMLISGLDVASAQDVPVSNELSQQLVSARIQTLRDTGSLAGEETTLGTYEEVLNWLGEAEVHAAAEKTYVQSLIDAPLQESEIRDRMESMDYRAPDYDPTSVSMLKKQEIDEQLSALRVKLRDAGTAKNSLDEQIVSEQSSAPNIQARFEAIDKRIQELPSAAITIEPDLQPSQFEATQWSVLAERKALVAERRSLEARLASQPVRYSKRKAESDEYVLILDGLTFEIGILEAELVSREKAIESDSSISLDEDSPGYGFVQKLVEGNAQLRTERAELDTTVLALKEENDRVEKQFLSLNDRFEAVQQIVSLSENSPSLGHVLMVHWHQTDSLQLPPTEVGFASEIGEHVIQRTQYEDSLATLSNTTAYLLNGFSVEIGSPEPEIDEDMLEAAKGRIRTKRELLTELIAIRFYSTCRRPLRFRIAWNWVPMCSPTSARFPDSTIGRYMSKKDMSIPEGKDAIRFFNNYLSITGLPQTGPEKKGDPALIGKRLGLVNGAAWTSIWAYYFGRKFLPGAQLINVGNEAVQVNFMQAHEEGKPVPPQSNIDKFVDYARDLVDLAQVNAVIITCSTMNRSYPQVAEALKPYRVPVIQIDRPMMETAVNHGGHILVVATHGPTVENTQALLRETAADRGKEVSYSGLNVADAWYRLADGDVEGHNEALANGIRASLEQEKIGCVVLAQLSMTVFLLSYPDPVAEFGVPVFTSGQCGFEAVREILIRK